MMKLKMAYDNFDKESFVTGLICLDLSKAVQSAAEEADINTIVRRFGLTGQLPVDVKAPSYGDFTMVTDYQSAMNAVLDAQASFYQMPADVRSRFDNDPGAFVDFCSDPGNREEMSKLGLLVPPEAPPSVLDVRVVSDPPVVP